MNVKADAQVKLPRTTRLSVPNRKYSIESDTEISEETVVGEPSISEKLTY